MTVLEIQKALDARGFDPGDLDGIWGRRTILAVRAFQKANGLTVDGIVGPVTARALDCGGALAVAPGASSAEPAEASAVPLVWYEEALRLVGVRERPGRASEPRLLAWARALDLDYPRDDIPWCGLFVAHCIGATLPEEELPTSPLWARAWRRFGEPCRPMRGAVLVFWRGAPDGAHGHVGLYHAEDADAFHVLGGNQSDAVNVARVAKRRLLAARWPRTAAFLTGTTVHAPSTGQPLSHDER